MTLVGIEPAHPTQKNIASISSGGIFIFQMHWRVHDINDYGFGPVLSLTQTTTNRLGVLDHRLEIMVIDASIDC